eukprot:jgi/Astpho2/3893/fgenesh1_pg.00062_%23_60_t
MLHLWSTPIVQGAVLNGLLQETGLELQQLAVVTQSGLLSKDALPQQAFDSAMSVADTAGHHTIALLAAMVASLRPGSTVILYEPMQGTAQQTVNTLCKQLLLAGFTDAAASTLPSRTAPADLIAVMAKKPSYQPGARAAISLKGKGGKQSSGQVAHGVAAAQSQPAVSKADASKVWALAASTQDDDLLDDDELLTEEDQRPPVVPAASDCTTSKKACKNCTCGRADAGAGVKVDLTPDMLDNPQSACGSCGLGDAFRCSTCPYRGLPKFELGKKVALTSDFLTADA